MDFFPLRYRSTHAPAGSASPAGQADGMRRAGGGQDVAGKLASRRSANDCDVVIAESERRGRGELRCATLRQDHKLRMRVFQIPAAGVTDDVSGRGTWSLYISGGDCRGGRTPPWHRQPQRQNIRHSWQEAAVDGSNLARRLWSAPIPPTLGTINTWGLRRASRRIGQLEAAAAKSLRPQAR
jgi:hypothetical protein